MGKLHSASNHKEWTGTTKASRRDIRKARESYKKHPTGVRCTLCGEYVEKLHQVRRADGSVVPGCAKCAAAARGEQVPQPPSFLDEPAAPVSGEWYAGWELLNRGGYQPVVLALPERTAVRNAEWRPVRRQLALMVGPRPRHIPSGPAIALGPGDRPSPYQPDEIEKWHDKLVKAMDKAIPLAAAYMSADGNMTGGEKNELNWNMTNAVQELQHTAFVYAHFLMAA